VTQAHLLVHRELKLCHALRARIRLKREGRQLYCLDIGIAVDDPAGHSRARIGLALGPILPMLRDINCATQLAHRPSFQQQSRVRRQSAKPTTNRVAEEVRHEHSCSTNVDQLDNALGARQSGPASALVAITRPANSSGRRPWIAEQVAGAPPADAHRVIAHQRLWLTSSCSRIIQGQQRIPRAAHADELPSLRSG